MVLRRADRQCPSTVAHDEERHFRTGEALLEDERAAGVAEASLLHRRDHGSLGLVAVGSDDDALARRQAVGLEHQREPERARPDDRQGGSGLRKRLVSRRRHLVARHEVFRKRLARLEAGGLRGRAEHGKAVLLEKVDQAEAQRQLGADDGEIDVLASSELSKALDVRHTYIKDAGVLGHSRVTGGNQQFGDTGFSGEPAQKGVLTRSASDDKNSHVVNDLGGIVELRTGAARRPVFR